MCILKQYFRYTLSICIVVNLKIINSILIIQHTVGRYSQLEPKVEQEWSTDFISSGSSLVGFSDEDCLLQGFGIIWINNFPIKKKFGPTIIYLMIVIVPCALNNNCRDQFMWANWYQSISMIVLFLWSPFVKNQFSWYFYLIIFWLYKHH